VDGETFNMAEQTLDISWETIIKVLITGFSLYILFLSRDIVIWFFFALIISLLVDPAIKALKRLKLPRVLAVVLVYVSIFGVLGLVIYLTAPIFIYEIGQLSRNIPDYFEKFSPFLKAIGFEVAKNFDSFTADLLAKLKESSGSIFKALITFFGGIYSTFMILTLAFYISLEKKGAESVLRLLIPKRYESHIITLFERAQFKVSAWFGARIIACLLVGVASFIVLFLFGVKYSFILALIAGLLNFIPYIGPVVTLILVTLFIGTSGSWVIAMYVSIALFVIHELEIKIFTPLLMDKIINLPPVLVLISLLVGEQVFGFLGMILAVPVFGIIYEFSKEFLEKRKEESAS